MKECNRAWPGWLGGISGVVLLAMLWSTGWAKPSPCPYAEVEVTMRCDRADQDLWFQSHQGLYGLTGMSYQPDVVGNRSLTCTYTAEAWESVYQRAGKKLVVHQPSEFMSLLEETADLQEDDLSEVKTGPPFLKLNFDINRKGKIEELESTALNLGLEEYVPSTNPEIPQNNKTIILLDPDSYHDGYVQGAYRTGEACQMQWKPVLLSD